MIEPGLFDMIMRLRSSGISDTNVLRAMETIPRSSFVAARLTMQSYDEMDLPIECGQSLSAPLTIAMMCQVLDVKPDHKVLHVGAGSGYATAILAKLCKRVYAVERYKTLVELAEPRLQKYAPNAVLRHGDGRLGWRGQAPFDRILVSAGVEKMPVALENQLAAGGRLALVIDDQLTVAAKARTNMTQKIVLKLSLPMIEAGKARAL